MPDEITFFDLVALLKIKPGTTVERYGGLINSSFFDGANVLGTLSQKKLVSLSTAMPDQNPITVTDVGQQLISEADTKAATEFDHLDLAILTQVSNGKSAPGEIGKAVNVRPKDLAMHLYKLTKQDFTTYEFVSGGVNVMLTENGFAQVKAGMPVKAAQPAPQQQLQQQKPMVNQKGQPMQPSTPPQPESMTIPMAPPPPMPGTGEPPKPEEQPKMEGEHKKSRKWLIIAIVIIIIIIAAVGYLWYTKYINIPI